MNMNQKITQDAGRKQLGDFTPDFAHFNDDVLFGENWNIPGIDLKTRCLLTVITLMAQGITDSSLVYHLENENNYLRKIINTLKQTLEKVFIWISNKLSVSEEDELIRKFEADNNTYINPEKQIEYEEEQEYDFEV